MASVVRKIAGTDPRTNAVGQAHPDMHSVVDRRYLGLDTDFSMRLTSLPFELQDLNATYTRNSVKNVVQNGALVQLAANQFGTSYDPVTGLYGYVPEPAATNLATNSDGNAATYTKLNTSNGTAVPGFTNGIYYSGGMAQQYAYKQLTLTAAASYSVSVFVIMDDGGVPVVGTSSSTGDFGLVIDSVIFAGAALVIPIGGGVYRVSASVASATGGAGRSNGLVKYNTQSARTFRITGIQIETGLRATSYIATAGSTVARAADVLTVPLANITGYSSAGYTLAVDQRMDTVLAAATASVELSDGTSANRAYLAAGSGVNAQIVSASASSAQVSTVFGALGLTRKKYAASFALNSAKCALAGVAGTEDTSCLMPVGLTTLHLGHVYNAISQYNGFVFNAKLIPTPLTQAQLNGLTT